MGSHCDTSITISADNMAVELQGAMRLQRGADLVMASCLLVLLSPLLLLRALWGALQTGRLFERQAFIGTGGEPFQQLNFTGSAPGRGLARLFNVLRGDLAMAGPRPLDKDTAATLTGPLAWRRACQPGIFSTYHLRERTGIAYQNEWTTDREFLANWSLKAYLGLIARCSSVSLMGYKTARITPARLTLFGISITNTTMSEAIDWLLTRAAARQTSNVAFVNADCLNKAYIYSEYHRTLNQADCVLPDGIGINIGARMLDLSLRENVNGTDLFPELCRRLADTPLSIFLLGARPGIAGISAEKMQLRFPGLKVAGTHHGYFSHEEEPGVIERINRSGADLLLVALGAPRQELWVQEHRHALQPPVRLGVGGLFDFYSDRIPRAPQWLRELGLEWIWRLLQEPGRMWRRYLVGNPLFIFRIWRQKVFGTTTAHASTSSRSAGRSELLNHFQNIGIYALRQRMHFHLTRLRWAGAIRSSHVLKRIIDTTLSAALLATLSPLLLGVAALIRMESAGPVFFSQLRVGRRGRLFRMWKFRSMVIDAEARKAELASANEMEGGTLFKIKDDPRITRVGRFLRRSSIDELPQLWNVLIGDMSLVGPRPALPEEVREYTLEERMRLEATPGITCIWQVSGRSRLPFQEQVKLDVEYIYSQSFFRDIRLILKTIPAVFQGQGAY
ncbi:MAG: WecB/TagA/CpsF family glycosyltransferase [Gammaproteobacteria bacterium]|nr:WecB/TagA/CpsF family glycosyltransferase [Gammaproteobacteria bacterium]MDH3559483.1 WecB/TagA/CpsF family glycosyltransferase [Gammaproteobacteria bacterium]